MKRGIICISILFILLILYFKVDISGADIIYVDVNGGKDYTRIQDAIAAANNGDTIFVYAGIYYENIIIDKRITLLGEGRDSVIIDGGSSGNVIIVRVSGVEISEVCIKNSGTGSAGIFLDNVNSVTINHCKIDNAYYGVMLSSASYNTIRENIISNSANIGINIDTYSHDNLLYHNNFLNNGVHAFDNGYSNVWYSAELQEGNYWDDYQGDDTDKDGIGDEPYPIEPATEINKDLYPLMQEYIGIGILHLQANPEIQVPNGSVNISCRIVASAEIEIAFVNITFPNGSYLIGNLSQIGNTSYYYFNHSFSSKGIYYYYVYVRDVSGNTAQSAIKKFVIAYKPTASFIFSPQQPTELDIVTFDASSSYDEDGFIVNYTWNFGDGSKAYDMIVHHQYEFDGSYTVRLTVYDNDGAWDTIEKEVVVINIPPVANFTYTPVNPIVGQLVQFNDSSYDMDGGIYIWQWDFGDGTTSNEKNPTHSYSKDGIYNVTLTVWDNDYASNSTTKQIVVTDIYPPHIENVTAYPNPQEINENVTISCIIYDDVEVMEARINISFPDGTYINDSLAKNGTRYYYSIYCIQPGLHNYCIWAVDRSGNANSSSIYNFTIITPPEAPHIENVSVKPPAQQQYGYAVNISCYVYDNVAVKEVKIIFSNANYSMNGITDAKGNGIYYFNSTFDMGTHEFYIYAEDINGKPNVTSYYSFEIIDKLPPSILNITYDEISQPGVINISCNVYDNRGVKEVYINISDGSSYINQSMLQSANLFYINEVMDSGKYTFYIWAIDLSNNSNASAAYSFVVTYFPHANFTWQPEQPTDLDFITFNASSSYDEDGFIANYTWNFGDGSIAYGSVVEHKYEYDGKYIVNLTVVDNDGAISWREKEIEVANIPPIANFTWQPPYPTTTDTIHFYSSSYDLDGSVANYTWNFGDGNIGYGKNVTHKYSNEGNYTVNLTIKDDNGDVAWIAKEIKVSVENHPPYATNPQPANNSFGISKYTDLSIIANDADGDILTVTFYDASDNLIGSVENILSGSTASVIWHDLEYSKTYYWYVIISDGKESVKSPVWHFTTKENEPPTKPTLAAPSSSYTNTPVTFSAVSMDDDRIRYGFDWDNDGIVNEWTNWYNSGVKVFVSHLWNSEGIYYVKVIAEDEYGMKSEWSNIHQITIMQYIPPPPTNHPPSIEITSPANGSIVSGIITIQGMASDKDGNESIVKVEIRIDGQQWKEAEGTTSWSYSWDTTEVSNGWHKIEARCYDGIDYSNIVSIKINVQNEEEKGINVMLFAAIFIIALFIAVAIYLRKKM